MTDRETLITEYISGYNAFDIPQMTKHLSDSIIFDNLQGDKVTMHLKGIDAFTQQAEAAKAYFSERMQTPTHFAHHADRTEVAIAYHGILAMDLPNGLKKGDAIRLSGKSVFYFNGSTISKIVDIS